MASTADSQPRPGKPFAKPSALPTLAERDALGWLHTARFLTTAAQLVHLPELDVPEIAFVGRSNAGKSTAINTLTQQNQLAFASRKPGRTQFLPCVFLDDDGESSLAGRALAGFFA